MLRIDSGYYALLAGLGLNTLAALRNRFDTRAASRPSVELVPARLERAESEAVEVFYKQYNFRRPSWRFLFRHSKARREFDNYETLRNLKIPVADRVACAEWRDWLGRLEGAFIITRTVPDALTLLEFWREHCRQPTTKAKRALRRSLGRHLASQVRRMHDGGFFHGDLYWRNLLVNWRPPEEPRLWWIDCPRGHLGHLPLFRLSHIIKDLACLDRAAQQLCTAPERRLFVRDYLGPNACRAAVESLARQVDVYRQKRWREKLLDY